MICYIYKNYNQKLDTGTIILIAGFAVPVIAVIIIFIWLGRGRKKMFAYADDLKQRQQRAHALNARIVKAGPGIQGGDVRRIVFFEFEILDSSNHYKAEAAWFVDTFSFSKAQPGEVISVKVDADNPKIIYPDIEWAVYAEGYHKTMSLKNLEGR